MKILIDEGLPQQLRHYRKGQYGHYAATVGYMGWRGTENGDLLDLAEAHDFNVLITGDQNLPYQQNLPNRKIAVVILATKDLQLETLELIVPEIMNMLEIMQPGAVVWIEGQTES